MSNKETRLDVMSHLHLYERQQWRLSPDTEADSDVSQHPVSQTQNTAVFLFLLKPTRSSSESSSSRPNSCTPGSPGRTICVSSSGNICSTSSTVHDSPWVDTHSFILYLHRGVAWTKCLSCKMFLFDSKCRRKLKKIVSVKKKKSIKEA